MYHFDLLVSIGQKYGPITEIKTPEQAREYLEACVTHRLRISPKMNRQEAIEAERDNIGYYAGYFSHEERERIERLFECEHPFFGAAKSGLPSPEQAFNLGKLIGEGKGVLEAKKLVGLTLTQ